MGPDGGTIVLAGGRVIDPSQGIDEVLDVVIREGRIAGLESGGGAARADVVDARGAIVTPGLVDLHGHWYEGSPYGLDPEIALRGGVTTVVDAGTCGFTNFDAFRRFVIDRAPVRVLAFVHVSAAGLATTVAGELHDLRYARPREAAATVRANPDVAVGIKVRIGRAACAANVDAALEAGLEAAELAGAPLMVDVHGGADIRHVARSMRPGDILTHCYIGDEVSIVAGDAVIPEVRAARQRGVRLDIGHGCGSFSWEVARTALREAMAPDTVSTDLHRFSIERPAVDLPTTMAKLALLGVSLPEVVRMATAGPVSVLHREDFGTLRPGAVADVTVLRATNLPADLVDAAGRVERSTDRLIPELVIRAGRRVDPGAIPMRLRPLVEADASAECGVAL